MSTDVAEVAEGLVVAEDLVMGSKLLVVALPVDGPAAVVGVEDGDLRVRAGSGERGAGFGEVFAELCDFGVERDGRAVGTDEGAVVVASCPLRAERHCQ